MLATSQIDAGLPDCRSLAAATYLLAKAHGMRNPGNATPRSGTALCAGEPSGIRELGFVISASIECALLPEQYRREQDTSPDFVYVDFCMPSCTIMPAVLTSEINGEEPMCKCYECQPEVDKEIKLATVDDVIAGVGGGMLH